MVLKNQLGSFMVTWQMMCELNKVRLAQAQLNHASLRIFADVAMMYRQKSMNYGPSRVTVFFSGIVIAAFGVAKRRKKDAAASICYVSIRIKRKDIFQRS